MAENESFFRKVVRFVANPTTDWTELSSRHGESRELELEKTELKAMIERKRRNDFVRKREFDTLRRVRREGLSPEHLAALGGSSRLDDSEARIPDAHTGRPSAGMKAKIDAIEQQMVGDGARKAGLAAQTLPAPPPRAAPGANSRAGALGQAAGPAWAPPDAGAARPMPTHPAPAGRAQHYDTLAGIPDLGEDDVLPALPPLPDLPDLDLPPAAAPAPVQMGAGLPPLALPTAGSAAGAYTAALAGAVSGSSAVDVHEVVHDPELDEAVIAFANADFTPCEAALTMLTGPGGARAHHAETWLVLFDLYRATGQQQRFESLALDFAHQFGWSAPQWYSLPRLVAEAAAEEPMLRSAASTLGSGDVGWVCPAQMGLEAVTLLRSQSLQMPLPWVLDWTQVTAVDPEAAMQLSTLFRLWAGQALEMHWIGGERLFAALQEGAPTGMRDADPALWLTRLDALRLANRPDHFDEVAIDYCVTYEVSPPSWEPARCKVRISSANPNTRNPHMSAVSELSTSFLESTLFEDANGTVEMAHVELSGQLVGDIGDTLRKLDGGLRTAPVVSVSCARLIRVDFIAAGDLLNWVLIKRNENRAVHFVDAHRLVALFFGAMGINEHSRVQVRKV